MAVLVVLLVGAGLLWLYVVVGRIRKRNARLAAVVARMDMAFSDELGVADELVKQMASYRDTTTKILIDVEQLARRVGKSGPSNEDGSETPEQGVAPRPEARVVPPTFEDFVSEVSRMRTVVALDCLPVEMEAGAVKELSAAILNMKGNFLLVSHGHLSTNNIRVDPWMERSFLVDFDSIEGRTSADVRPSAKVISRCVSASSGIYSSSTGATALEDFVSGAFSVRLETIRSFALEWVSRRVTESPQAPRAICP